MAVTLELSPKTLEILSTVGDRDLRRDMEGTLLEALQSLAALSRIHLPQDTFEERSSSTDQKRVELAPYVLAAVAAINRLLAQIGATYQPPAASGQTNSDDFDLEFDLVDGPTGDGAKLGQSDATPQNLSPRERVAESLYALGGMLRSRVQAMGQRLQHAMTQPGDWPLLAELDDSLHGLRKAVQGLIFDMLGVFNNNVRREEILSEYRSAVKDAVDLRAAITELSYHIGRTNAVIANAGPEQLVPLLVAVADRLSRFAERPEYRSLRPEDKKAVIDFRGQLHQLRFGGAGVPQGSFRQAVEGFSKFLEAMGAINHREVLIVHDRQRLSEAAQQLHIVAETAAGEPQLARGQLANVLEGLAAVYGRHPDLDELIRQRSAVASVATPALAQFLSRARGLVDAALSVVG